MTFLLVVLAIVIVVGLVLWGGGYVLSRAVVGGAATGAGNALPPKADTDYEEPAGRAKGEGRVEMGLLRVTPTELLFGSGSGVLTAIERTSISSSKSVALNGKNGKPLKSAMLEVNYADAVGQPLTEQFQVPSGAQSWIDRLGN